MYVTYKFNIMHVYTYFMLSKLLKATYINDRYLKKDGCSHF